MEAKRNFKKHFSDFAIWQINSVLENPTEDFDININTILDRIINISTKRLSEDPKCQKLFFEQTCSFLNSIFGNVHIKKFYNTAPILSFKEYDKMTIWQEATHNIYGKERKLFYKNQVGWWSCHHWTILLKKIFDELQSKWLNVKSRILLYSNIGWHSLVGIQFQGKLYIADASGINYKFNKIISSLDELPKEFSKHLAHFSFNKKHDKDGKMIYFDDRKEFVDNVSEKPIKNISLKFKPKLKNLTTDVSLDINKNSVILGIDWEVTTFPLPKNFTIPTNIVKTHKILDHILHNVSWNKEQKYELQQYLSIVATKINPEKLKSIFD